MKQKRFFCHRCDIDEDALNTLIPENLLEKGTYVASIHQIAQVSEFSSENNEAIDDKTGVISFDSYSDVITPIKKRGNWLGREYVFTELKNNSDFDFSLKILPKEINGIITSILLKKLTPWDF